MVLIDNQPRGYSANYIKGNLLSCSLRDNNISLETKIDYLKQIGLILRNMSEIRKKHSHLSNFFYNDIHEDNFLVTSQNIVYGVDLDSCSIKDNIPIQALYPLTIERYKLFNSKYKPCNQVCDCTTTIIPNEDLDLFCYITMILNFISGKSLYRWTPNKLDVYLNFLESNGANLEFLYLLSHIYNEEPNINPDYLLDYIKEIYSYGNIYNDKSEELQKILRR